MVQYLMDGWTARKGGLGAVSSHGMLVLAAAWRRAAAPRCAIGAVHRTTVPHRIAADVAERICAARQAHPTPASCYAPSPRPYRASLPPLLYPGHYERRLVSRNGGIRWNKRWVNVSHLFAELEIGFEEIDDRLWNVHFGPVWLGRFHEEVGRIVDQLGRPARRTGDNHKGKDYRKVLPIT